ncbi:MAG: VWA domain-containing protein [Bacteroidales bacterium]|nr:VWA domain-containing protein [Bacteroidales bacterium]
MNNSLDVTKKINVYSLFILDESGSMLSIKNNIISGFNDVLNNIKYNQEKYPDQNHLVSFLTFNSTKMHWVYFNTPIYDVTQLDADNYNPFNGTPLYDAIGMALYTLKKEINSTDDNYHVEVFILTDGMENSSKKFSKIDIKMLIEQLKKQNWNFQFIGIDFDVTEEANNLSISKVCNVANEDVLNNQLFTIQIEYYSGICNDIDKKTKKK